MEIETLRIFREVAERRSFAAVARARDVDPSAISRSIAVLEDELGLRLLQRSTRAMALTEAGARYLSGVDVAIAALEQAQEAASLTRSTPTGTLRLTTSASFAEACLLPRLAAFRARFPQLELELVLSAENLDLVAEGIDLAIRLAPGAQGDLVASRLMATRYRVVASPDYLARCGAPRTPAALSASDCLRFSFPGFRSLWRFRRGRTVTEVPVRGSFLMSSGSALRLAALDGLGPALLADWLIGADLRTGRLVDLFPAFEVTATEFDTAAWLIYPSRAHLPLKLRVVIDFLREVFAAPARDSGGR
jgi:DNA-binding transcriptional LysR family regulator